ncbi:DUF6279 family lipoprotein [Bdellovibrio svalbardensis]|nr:DUF6279 family lipoprotein [Bdellovibrio svalbardensis]
MTQIDQYFDLDTKQHEQLEQNIDADLDRLRKARFKQIAKTLREIEKSSQKSDNKKVMSAAYADLQKEYLEASTYFKGSTVKLITSLKEPQLKTFKTKAEKEISETKLAPPEVLNEELIGRYKRGLEFWVGDLTTAQQQSIAQFTREHPFPWNEKIKNKEAILNRFMAVHQDPVQLRKFSEDFVSEYPKIRIPTYATAVTAYEKEFQNFLDSFWISLSPEQKNRLQEYLIVRADKLEQLAKRP